MLSAGQLLVIQFSLGGQRCRFDHRSAVDEIRLPSRHGQSRDEQRRRQRHREHQIIFIVGPLRRRSTGMTRNLQIAAFEDGPYGAIQQYTPQILDAAHSLQTLDQTVYDQAEEAYLHLVADRIAEIRSIAEWLERIVIDDAKASGYPLAPFARITGRGTGTVSRWGEAPLLETEDGRFGPGTLVKRKSPRQARE